MKITPSALPPTARDMLTQNAFGADLALPDVQAIAEARQGPTIASRAQIEFQNTLAKGFNLGTQVGGARIATSIGFPAGHPLDSVIELVTLPAQALDVGHEFFSILEDVGLTTDSPIPDLMATLETAMTDVAGALADVTSGIPVYGWGVKVIWNVIDGIRRLVDLIRGDDPEVEYPRVQFTSSGDLLAGNDAMDLVGGLDWTDIFSPFGGLSKAQYGSDYFRSVTIEGGGQRVFPASEGLNGFGMIPGTTSMHQYLEVEPGAAAVRDTGRFYPTARNVGVYAWGQGNLESVPSLYSVNAKVVRERWASYLFNLRMWIRETKALKEKTKRKLVDNPTLVRQFGWGPYDMPFKSDLGYENFGIDDPDHKIVWKRVNVDRNPDGKPAQTGVAHPVHFAREQEQRQWAALDTLMCAYVSSQQGAFQGFRGEDMAARLEIRRKQLKQHPAACSAKLEDVVDPVYKAALEFAVEGMDCNESPASSLMRMPGDLFGKPPRKGANPVPADAPAYIDSVMVTGALEDSKARRRNKGPTFIQEYGPAAAALVAIAAVGGLAYRNRKASSTS